jgi:hypothetical protein
MKLAKAALFSSSLLFLLAARALHAAPDCPPPPPNATGTEAWADVVKYMGENDDELQQVCTIGKNTILAPEKCASAINSHIEQHYQDITARVGKAYDKLGAIKISSPLMCSKTDPKTGASQSAEAPQVTSESLSLAYRINPSKPEVQQAELQSLANLLKPPASDIDFRDSTVRLAEGRGTVLDYQRAVDQLACLYPSHFKNAADAHAFLVKSNLGIDCAGSVQIMLRESSGLFHNVALGLDAPNSETFEKSAMKSRKRREFFSYDANPLNMRPGDIIPLDEKKHRVGHVVMVKEVEFKVGTAGGFGRPGDMILQAKVASSWGGTGPELRTWLYDAQTKRWATLNDDGSWTDTPHGPYDHIYSGQFRSLKLPSD